MIPRILEPEEMDTPEEALAYDAMDHSEVNRRYIEDLAFARGGNHGGSILDLGTGPGHIAILIAETDPGVRVTGLDLARHMIELARRHAQERGVAERVRFELADAKGVNAPDSSFDAVVSNSIIHHIPAPGGVLAEMVRLTKHGGLIFCRDLARPESCENLDHLVERYAGHEPEAARQLFAASLHAALTVEEVRELVLPFGAPGESVGMTSDRHWTWTWRRP
jgi:ubiquinone/menaquinone biosynthesis C-methylase UbiE